MTQHLSSVVKLKEGRYKLNDVVIIENFSFNDGSVVYDLSYDHTQVTEPQAIELCEEFLHSALLD